MKYENIDAFAKRVGKHRRTIFRFYNRYPELKNETKKKRERLIPITHKKYWNSELLFENNKLLSEENRMMRNLLEYLHGNKNPLANKLWGLDWSYFVSVDYKFERNKNYSITMMNQLFEMLDKKYGKETTIRMFYTTESFANRNNGQHNHIMLYVENGLFRQMVLSQIKTFFKKDRVDASDYAKYKGGLFYMMKEGTQGIDWDILGNNLVEEGEKYEGKGYKKAV